jgi:hypothetical protein
MMLMVSFVHKTSPGYTLWFRLLAVEALPTRPLRSTTYGSSPIRIQNCTSL